MFIFKAAKQQLTNFLAVEFKVRDLKVLNWQIICIPLVSRIPNVTENKIWTVWEFFQL